MDWKQENIREIVVRLPEEQSHTINDRLIPDANCQYQLAWLCWMGKSTFIMP
jgi:hypothetical protein